MCAGRTQVQNILDRESTTSIGILLQQLSPPPVVYIGSTLPRRGHPLMFRTAVHPSELIMYSFLHGCWGGLLKLGTDTVRGVPLFGCLSYAESEQRRRRYVSTVKKTAHPKIVVLVLGCGQKCAKAVVIPRYTCEPQRHVLGVSPRVKQPRVYPLLPTIQTCLDRPRYMCVCLCPDTL